MSRFAFHLSWNQRSEQDMLLYRALRELPHGFSKQVIIRLISAVVGECDDPKQIANVLFHFANAKDALARSVIVGGAPLDWRAKSFGDDVLPTRDTRAARRTVRANEFVRAATADAPPGFTYALVREEAAAAHTQQPDTGHPPPAPSHESHGGAVIVPPAPQDAGPPRHEATQPPREEAAHPEHVAARAPAQASLGLMP